MACYDEGKKIHNHLIKTNYKYYLKLLEDRFNLIDNKKYALSYSGGRDSHFLYWFIKNYLKDDKIKIVSVNTQLEHPEIRKRMYKYADIVLLPFMKHAEIKKLHGSPCFSKFQDEYICRYQNGSRTFNTMKTINGENSVFKLSNKARVFLLNGKLHKISHKCCVYLKKKPLKKYQKENGFKPILGVRGVESKNRKYNFNKSLSKDGTFTPIYDLSDEMLLLLEKKFHIPVPKIYNKLSRTGCMGCPYGRNIKEELSLLSDSQRKFIVNYFYESYKIKEVV